MQVSFITKNWRGRPLTSFQVIVELVAATTTATGLRSLAEWDQGNYPTGIKVSDAELAGLPLAKHEWHPSGITTSCSPEPDSQRTVNQSISSP